MVNRNLDLWNILDDIKFNIFLLSFPFQSFSMSSIMIISLWKTLHISLIYASSFSKIIQTLYDKSKLESKQKEQRIAILPTKINGTRALIVKFEFNEARTT